MVLKTIGIILLGLGIIFLLIWSNTLNTQGGGFTADFFLGVILLLGGVGLLWYNPVEAAVNRVSSATERFMDRSTALPAEVKEKAENVQQDAQKFVQETKKEVKNAPASARKRINRIAKEIEDLTSDEK